jgi:hypothetical protein
MHALNTNPCLKLAFEPLATSSVRSEENLDAALRDLEQQGFNGFKHLWVALSPDLNVELVSRAESTIFLYRKNYLQAAVSAWIGKAAGTMVDKEKFDRVMQDPAFTTEPLPVEWARDTIEAWKKETEVYREVCNEMSPQALELTYEELFGPEVSMSARMARVASLEAALDLPPLADPERLVTRERALQPARKMNDAATWQRVPNIQQVEAQLGSDDTGYLFRGGDAASR